LQKRRGAREKRKNFDLLFSRETRKRIDPSQTVTPLGSNLGKYRRIKIIEFIPSINNVNSIAANRIMVCELTSLLLLVADL
jgi:transposase